MANITDKTTYFKPISIAQFQSNSYIGTVARYGAWSFSSGFNPGVTAAGSDYRIDPNTCTLPELRNFVMTNYMNQFKDRLLP